MATKDLYPSIRPSLNLDFANSKVLDPRITFGRPSAATYYDGKTVAKAEENLFTRSQEFSNSFWNKYDATVAGSSTTAPDGTLTASKLSEASTASVSKRIDCTLPSLQSTNYTISIYAKSAELSYLRITEASTGTARTSWFNVAAGTLGTTSPSHSATIIAAGNGWFRCSIAFLASTVTPGPSFGISNADNVSVYAGNGSDGLHLWGAQLEQRSQVTAYTPTTSQPITNYIPVLQTAPAGVPRFDHNPVTGESLGLLIEEQRTNLLQFSGGMDSTSAYGSGSSFSIDYISPDGTLSGVTLVDSDPVNFSGRVRTPVTISTSSTYTFSTYVKKGSSDSFALWLRDTANSLFFKQAVVTWVNGVPTAIDWQATNIGNGWYRLSTTFVTAANSTTLGIYYHGGPQTGIGSTVFWGSQLEAGAFPTSYIKTEASQVTRAADSAQMTGANFSSWYRQDEGTLYGEYNFGVSNSAVDSGGGTITRGAACFSDGTTNNRLRFGAASFSFNVVAAGTVQASFSVSQISANTAYKAAATYKANEFQSAVSGVLSAVDSQGTTPVCNRLDLGRSSSDGTGVLCGYLRKLAYYPKAFPSNLQALTA